MSAPPPSRLPPAHGAGGQRATEVGRAFVSWRRANLVVVLWRWRYEVGAATAAGLVVSQIGLLWTVAIGLGVGAAAVTRPLRRRVWCVVTPHRVRTGCVHAWIHSRTGRLPMVVWTRPVDGGEAVLLWLRPGVSAADLVDAAPMLAAACWAAEVTVEPYPTRAQLVWLRVRR